MFSFFHRSLRNKLIISFLTVALFPFAILLAYTIFMSQSKIIQQTTDEQFSTASHISYNINSHLQALQKEVNFIASLDLMDDILADDIDKRISILLSKSTTDFTLDMNYYLINKNNTIIASADKVFLDKSFVKKTSQLYMKTVVYASFDSTKQIGALILEYSLNNLQNFLIQRDGVHSYITNVNHSIVIGEDIKILLSITENRASSITKEHLIVYEKLQSPLKEYYLVYAVDKSLALKFLNDFIDFMLYLSLIMAIVIIFITLHLSKSIVKPIEKLTNATKKITKGQDYTTVLEIDSEDETALLTHSFNAMLETTSIALSRLELENKLRLQRFVQLIEVFNKIIQTKSEDACIELSIVEIKKITNRNNLYFSSQVTQNTIDIYVTNFETSEKEYFGSISLGIESFSDKNEKSFYNSIASMVALQIDRIRLISRTMAVSQAKSAFISNMSHELRTPLNAIIGFSQFLITYEDLSDDQQDTVGNIESSAHYLLEMINEILDIAKIEAGKMEAHKEDTDIITVLQNTFNMLQPLASEKDLEMSISIEDSTQEILYTDPKMFQQILTNLLSNAIKFTQVGSIKIKVSADETHIYVRVKDTGLGIAPEDLKNLFNDFTQVENIMQKKHKGTGLGLSLSKKMANILGGDVILESLGLGKGTLSIFSILKGTKQL